MKKLLTLIAVGAVAISATADLTQFAWTGGTLADQVGGTIPYGQATVLTVLDADAAPDILGFVSGGTIDIVDLQAFAAYAANLTVGAPFGPQNLLATGNIDGDGSVAGQYAYAIVTAGQLGAVDAITVGSFIGITADANLINDLQPNPSLPPSTKQTFNPGAVQTNIEVVPEPATLGLMGIAGLSMFLVRRKARR